MGVAVACGDSRSYYRTKQGQLRHLGSNQIPYWPNAYSNVANQLVSQHQMLAFNSAANQVMAYQMVAARNSAQNALPPQAATAPDPKSSTRVITDMGFGGGEAKPRSRRYAKCSGKEKRTAQPLAPD